MSYITFTAPDIFSALAESTRRHIIEILASRGQLSATDISDQFKSSPPSISQHLKVLRQAKLVQVEKRAQQRLYQLNPAAVNELEGWVKHLRQCWNQRFDAFDVLLKEEKGNYKK